MKKIDIKAKSTLIIGSVIGILFLIVAINLIRFILKEPERIQAEERIPVETTIVGKKNIAVIINQVGEVRSQIEINVYSKIPGKIIKEIYVEKGDIVKKGDRLATLEKTIINARVRQAKAAVDMAKANLDVIEKDYNRIEYLYYQKAAAKQKLDHIIAQKTSANAQLQLALAALREVEIYLRDHTIYAPAAGYITDRYVDKGAMSSQKQPIVHISSKDNFKIITFITEKNFPFIKKGLKAEIKTDALPDRIFLEEISLVAPSLDPRSRTARVEVHLKNQDLPLRSGMFTHIKIYLREKEALVVPRDALNLLPGTGVYYVFIVEQGIAILKNLKIGIKQGNYVEVLEGLNGGETLVVNGQNRLKDGVRIINSEQEGNMK